MHIMSLYCVKFRLAFRQSFAEKVPNFTQIHVDTFFGRCSSFEKAVAHASPGSFGPSRKKPDFLQHSQYYEGNYKLYHITLVNKTMAPVVTKM